MARDYIERYRVPILLGETNLWGTVTDRLTWLKFMTEQCEQLQAEGVDLRGFCWYPSIDSTDWSNGCTRCTALVDPQGIWWLDRGRWDRHPSALSVSYSLLARYQITSRELPSYIFQTPLDEELRNFIPLMRHWNDWREPHAAERVA